VFSSKRQQTKACETFHDAIITRRCRFDGKSNNTSENVRKGLMETCDWTTFREKFFSNSEAPASESLGRALAGRTQSRNASRKRSSSSLRMVPPPAKRSCSSFRSRDSQTPTHNRCRYHCESHDATPCITVNP